MQKAIIIVSIILGYLLTISAQGVKIGNNSNVADASAMLDVESTNKGLLAPRMTQAQRDAIPSPATGLLIFQTDGTAGFYYWTGSAWEALDGTPMPIVCDVTASATASFGTITVTGAEGTQPYSYQWDGSASHVNTASASAITEGTYNVTVTDANGCTATASASWSCGALTVAIYSRGSASLEMNPTGGTPPYTYLWSDGQTAATAIGLTPGTTYQGTVTDVNGCFGTSSALVPSYLSGTVHCNSTATDIIDVTSPTGKTWMDRNLGASQVATSSTDANSYGDLYQWGRFADGHQCRTSATTTTLSSVDQPVHGTTNTTDQEQTSLGANLGSAGQQFVAGLNGNWSILEVSSPNIQTGRTLNIYNGIGTGGSLLGTITFDLSIGINQIIISPAVTTTASQSYTFTTDAALGYVPSGNLYTPGEAYNGASPWVAGSDIYFKIIHVTVTVPYDFIMVPSISPYDWRSPQNTNLWQGVNGTNNPCPSGYRLPTDTELDAERGTWSSQDAAGAFASPLKLPVAGGRNYYDGLLNKVGVDGYYWSCTVNGVHSYKLYFSSSAAHVDLNTRAGGVAVRCLKD